MGGSQEQRAPSSPSSPCSGEGESSHNCSADPDLPGSLQKGLHRISCGVIELIYTEPTVCIGSCEPSPSQTLMLGGFVHAGPPPSCRPHPSGRCSRPAPHLLEQSVVGAVQVELPQVVPIGKDEEGLFVCTEGSEEGSGPAPWALPTARRAPPGAAAPAAPPPQTPLTRDSLTAGGVVGFELVALYAQALVAPQGVDALLAAGVGGGALVDVDARLPVVLQPEPGTASALQEASGMSDTDGHPWERWVHAGRRRRELHVQAWAESSAHGAARSGSSAAARRAGMHSSIAPEGPYLVPDLEVLTLLGAAAQLLVEALVDEAVEFVGAVGAVVVVVAQQSLRDALPVLAHEEGIVAFALCRGVRGSRQRQRWGSPTARSQPQPCRHLGCCSAGSWAPHPSGRGNQTPHRTPTDCC